jgi:hypothetical protein
MTTCLTAKRNQRSKTIAAGFWYLEKSTQSVEALLDLVTDNS